MDTLTYGMKVPRNPDTGATFWGNLEDNFENLDAHRHNGVDSRPMGKTQSISGAAWGSDLGGGQYRQLINIAASWPGLTFDAIGIEFRTSAGVVVYPTVEKASSTTYYVYSNDSSLALTAVYI